ncbi:hypothetical protein BV372_00050 [Nostoc sp. T09]|nr:hypothetical protein BV372_00050 [Nostoc sp. T09]
MNKYPFWLKSEVNRIAKAGEHQDKTGIIPRRIYLGNMMVQLMHIGVIKKLLATISITLKM